MLPHSVPVPRLYKLAAKATETVDKTGDSVKSIVYKVKHPNTKALYALIVETLKHTKQLEFLLKRTKLLENETGFNPWLAKVLITELLWGKKHLLGECKPIKTILAYQQVLNAHASDVHENFPTENKVRKPRFVRVNTLLVSIKDAINGFRDEGWTLVRYTDTKNYNGFLDKVANLSEYEFMVDIHIPEVLIFPSNTEFYAHHAYKNGMIILQDKASCLCGHLLNPPPGSAVLDMCAAPGMKTSHLAAKLNNEGKVYAVDLDDKRLKNLELLMEKNGITCVQTINKDVLKVTNSNCPEVKYILVDPSCSGSGIINRLDLFRPTIKDDNRISKLRGFQIMILKHALRRFPNAQRVIYSTCSLYPEENEEVVAEVLSQTTKFKLINAAELINTPWHNFGSEKYGNIGKYCLYSRPEKDFTNGFFVAVFERLGDDEVNEYYVENSNFQNTSSSKSNKENNEISTTVEEDEIKKIPESESKTKKNKKKREANNAVEIKEDFLEIQNRHEKSLSSTEIEIEEGKEQNSGQQNKKKKHTKKNLNDTMKEKEHNIEYNVEEDGNTEIPNSESKRQKKKKKREVNNADEMNEIKEDGLEAQNHREKSLYSKEIEIEGGKEDNSWQQNKKKKRTNENLNDIMKAKAHNIEYNVEEDRNIEIPNSESKTKKKKKKREVNNADEMKGGVVETQTHREKSLQSREIEIEKDNEENSGQHNKKKTRNKEHLYDTIEKKAHEEDRITEIPESESKRKKKTWVANNIDETREDFLEAQTHEMSLLSTDIAIEKDIEENSWQQNNNKKKRKKENLNDIMKEKAHNIEYNVEEDRNIEIPNNESKTKKKKKKREVNNADEMNEMNEMKEDVETQTHRGKSLSSREIEIEKDNEENSGQHNKKKERKKEHLYDTMEKKAHEEDRITEIPESESKRKKKTWVANNIDETREDFLEAQTHEMSLSSTEIAIEKDIEENSWQQNNNKKKRKKENLNDTMEEKSHNIQNTFHNIPEKTKKKKRHHHLENDEDKEMNIENKLENIDENLLTENNLIIKDDDISSGINLEKKKRGKHKSKVLANTPSEEVNVHENMVVLNGDKSKSKNRLREMGNSKNELDAQEMFDKKRKKRNENVAIINDIESDQLSNLLIGEANSRLDNMIKKNEEMEISENKKNNEDGMRKDTNRNEMQ